MEQVGLCTLLLRSLYDLLLSRLLISLTNMEQLNNGVRFMSKPNNVGGRFSLICVHTDLALHLPGRSASSFQT